MNRLNTALLLVFLTLVFNSCLANFQHNNRNRKFNSDKFDQSEIEKSIRLVQENCRGTKNKRKCARILEEIQENDNWSISNSPQPQIDNITDEEKNILIQNSIEKARFIRKNGSNPMEGGFFEGDMKGLNPLSPRGLAIANPKKRWPKGVIPYKIDGAFGNDERLIIREGLDMIERKANANGRCIKFVKYTNQRNYVNVISDTGCYSSIGKNEESGSQDLSLQIDGCVNPGTVAHEFMHAIGFFHEQSRPDRDNYVKINFSLIPSSLRHNFEKYRRNVETFGLPYDYDSIMHYGKYAFSTNNQPTIVPLDESVDIREAYEKTSISDIDAQAIRILYKCD